MASELIVQALKTATETKEIVFGEDILHETGAVFSRVFPGASAIVVADDNTYAAAGDEVVESLVAAGVQLVDPYIFPGTPTLYAGYENVELLREHLRPLEGVVVCSIASGSLNDIAKLASGELGREYLNVCTAASVDGYASFGASISKDGFKITRDCPAPAALIVDTALMTEAPERLTATGYGDLIEKIPAGADWILADVLGIEAIDPYIWSLVQEPLGQALDNPEGIAAKDVAQIGALAESNIMSGLAMQAMQSSRPASGAGHQFSHVWEMQGHGLDWEPPLSHGFKVGIGTVASCALWEETLKLDVANLDVDAIVAAAATDDEIATRVRESLEPRIADEAVKHAVGKNLQGEELRQRIISIQQAWPEIVKRVRPQLISPEDAATRLDIVGAPSHPEAINIDWDRFRRTHFLAQMIRPRYTVLDLLTEIGALGQCVERLFSPEGYWGRRGHLKKEGNDQAEAKLTIGIDFGTLSARAVVVRTTDGAVIGEATSDYRHGVMDERLSAGDGRQLPPDFALEVPADYLAAMQEAVSGAITASGADPNLVIGLGLDCTSSTVVVTDAAGIPLCAKPEFVNEPHAYIKLWKHHGGAAQVARIVELAQERSEAWLDRFGGTLSSEMLVPKALETLEKAPKVYHAAEEILDVLDWLTWQLTGNLVYSASDSGYKRLYHDGTYPSPEFLTELNPEFGGLFTEKMSHDVVALGERVGGLQASFAERLGLPAGIAVATGNIDAHVHAASVGAVEPGQLTGIIGTSTCWVLPAETLELVPGVFGVVEGGISEGTWGYEAGQSAVGDMLAWFVENCVPEEYSAAAESRGISLHDLLTEKAAEQEIGEHGLIALDWWNGNRSILVDSDLTGLVVGQTLATKPEDLYRALMEATAFGARVIIENYEDNQVPVNEISIAGGLLKNRFFMQLYADVTRRPLAVATVENAGAHGSAIFASLAAGAYSDLREACARMGGVLRDAYLPREEAALQYDQLYAGYLHLYRLFGQNVETMHQLKQLRREAIERRIARAEA